MSIVLLSNKKRQCGQMKQGGVYLVAEKTPGGTLSIWTWILGSMIRDEKMSILCSGSIPPRVQVEVNPQETLRQSTFWPYEWGYIEGDTFNNIPIFGLADHVGADNYTPITFAKECSGMGPSRRIRRDLAKNWADKIPFPILFSHEIPIWKTADSFDKFMHWAFDKGLVVKSDGTYASGRTWENPGFGFGVLAYGGNDHIGVAAMEALTAAAKGKVSIPDRLEPDYEESLFGASWVTKLVQIKMEDEDIDEDLADVGVSKGVLYDEEEG